MLQNRVTELNNQLRQRKRWAKGTSIVNSNRLILNLPFDSNICILTVKLEDDSGKYFGYGYLNSDCPNHQIGYELSNRSSSTVGYVNLTKTGTNFTIGGGHKVVSCDWFVAE
ncbi:hypothetical protein KGF49_09375 [Clostridioides sp. ZZV14-5902]|nr:hypothetical protein [Clostridioides sp. ZZV14-6153]MCC0738721.1 hypothetical protein [Clostridioides sp. ZZV14-5902]